MSFLMDYGLTNEDIEEIEKRNDEAVLKNILLNKKNVMDIIEYLKDVGINISVIKEIFVYQIGIFFRTKDEIKDVFDEYEIDSIIKSLNYDVNTIDLIEFS